MKLYFKILVAATTLLLAAEAYAQPVVDTVCGASKGVVYRVKQTPGSEYYWSLQSGGGQIASPISPADSILIDWNGQAGTYLLSVVEKSATGCWGDTVKGLVLVNPTTNVSVDGPFQICAGKPVMLTASGAQKYRWMDPNAPQSILMDDRQSIVVYPTEPTTYNVVGFGGCETDTASIYIDVVPAPMANFAMPDSPKTNQPFLPEYLGAQQVDWYANGAALKETPEGLVFEEGGPQTITVVVTNKLGCKDSIVYNLYVSADAHIYMPNAFTPNNDKVNDILRPVMHSIKSLEIEIFNRWGQRMYYSNSLDAGWDGSFKGELAPEGKYIYTIKAQGDDYKWHYLDGEVVMLR